MFIKKGNIINLGPLVDSFLRPVQENLCGIGYLRTEQRFNFSHVRRLQSLWPPAPRPRSPSTWPPLRRWEIVMSGPIFVNIIIIISNNTTIIMILAAAQMVGGQIIIDCYRPCVYDHHFSLARDKVLLITHDQHRLRAIREN